MAKLAAAAAAANLKASLVRAMRGHPAPRRTHLGEAVACHACAARGGGELPLRELLLFEHWPIAFSYRVL